MHEEEKHHHEQPKEITNIFVEETIVVINEGEHHHGHHHHKHPQRVRQVLFFNINHYKSIAMSLSIPSNQSAPIVLGLIDSDTQAVITATFTGETETSDNTAAATTDPVLGLVGVAPGTGNLISVATWTYTDGNTQALVTKEFTTTTPFEVTAVVVAGENVAMVVTLGTPVHQ